MSRISHLKVKIVNLADEARTIRKAERLALAQHHRAVGEQVTKRVRRDTRQAGGPYPVEERLVVRIPPGRSYCREYQGLQAHRVGTVRNHARHNLLAYGFLRGVPYEAMERTCRESPNFSEVRKIAVRFTADLLDSMEPTVVNELIAAASAQISSAWDAWEAEAKRVRKAA